MIRFVAIAVMIVMAVAPFSVAAAGHPMSDKAAVASAGADRAHGTDSAAHGPAMRCCDTDPAGHRHADVGCAVDCMTALPSVAAAMVAAGHVPSGIGPIGATGRHCGSVQSFLQIVLAAG